MARDKIIIKGNKEGINAIIDMKSFDSFQEMLDTLVAKLSKGKKFYEGVTLSISINLSDLKEGEGETLKNILIDEISVKEVIFENLEIEQKEAEGKSFSGVYEGRTKFIRKTVRGGQRVEYTGNIVIIGDVNSGAEVYAGGNIIVLGSIKGNVYAGTYGNSKAIIAAFALSPEILKIGDIITISPDDFGKPKYPEVAKIKDGSIIVEPYLTNKYTY